MRSAILFFTLLALTGTAEAKQAKCWIGAVHDHDKKEMEFRLDSSTYPFVFEVKGEDPRAPKYREFPLYDKSNPDHIDGYYLSRVISREMYDGKLAAYTIIFGELYFDLVEQNEYTLYVDWPNNRYTWVDGLIATSAQDEPSKYTYPARCQRID